MKSTHAWKSALVCTIVYSQFSLLATGQNQTESSSWQLYGSIASQARFYGVDGIPSRRQPFIWNINGSPTIKHNNFSMPIVFTVGNLQSSSRQPFNKIGVMPTYKFIKGYVGFNRMKFSKYTLQDRMFLGAGLELNPGIFRFGAVYGRFNKSVDVGDNALTGMVPNYNRWGYAIKVGLGSHDNYLDLIALKATDDSTSLNGTAEKLTAQENTVLALKTKQVFLKHFTFTADAAASGYTRNLDSRELETGYIEKNPWLKQIFNPKYASSLGLAFSANLEARWHSTIWQFAYERIDPEFRSFMTYFFINDVERITGSVRFSLIKRKLQLFAKGGLETNNVSETKFARSKRLIGMFNLSFVPNRMWAFSANYSSFTMNQQIVRDVFSDSVKIAQINQSGSAFINFNHSNSQFRHQVNLSGGLQKISSENSSQINEFEFNNIFGLLNYTLSHLNSAVTVKLEYTFNRFEISLADNRHRSGFSLAVSKQLLEKKLLLGGKIGWFQTNSGSINLYQLFVPGLNAKYVLNKHHSLAVNAFLNMKSAKVNTETGYNEWQGVIAYRYTF